MSDEDFNGFCNIMCILKPLQSAQGALEGDKYGSMMPYIIHQLQIELELYLGAANTETQGDLTLLLNEMIDDFKSRWGDELSYSQWTRNGDRNCQIGVHAYSYWVMALVPQMKKYSPKILTNCRETQRLCDDIKECYLEEARAARNLNQEEEEQIDVVAEQRARANNKLIVENMNRCGAASFFPESSDKEMEEADIDSIAVEGIASNEI